MVEANKLTAAGMKNLLASLPKDDDGNVLIDEGTLKQIQDSTSSAYNQDYSKRTRIAAARVRDNHMSEYQYYVDILKDDMSIAKEDLPAFTGK